MIFFLKIRLFFVVCCKKVFMKNFKIFFKFLESSCFLLINKQEKTSTILMF